MSSFIFWWLDQGVKVAVGLVTGIAIGTQISLLYPKSIEFAGLIIALPLFMDATFSNDFFLLSRTTNFCACLIIPNEAAELIISCID